MGAFLQLALRGRLHAAVAATGLALASILLGMGVAVLPPLLLVAVAFYFASAALVGLVALRHGPGQAVPVAAGPALLWSAPALLSGARPVSGALLVLPAAWTVGGVLAPLVAMAAVLRVTHDQGLALVAGAVLIAVALVALHAAGVDPVLWLTGEMLPVLREMYPEADWAGLERGLEPDPAAGLARGLTTGVYAANTLVALAATLFVARWWHAKLDNPGGFGREFRALRLPRPVAVVALALLAVTLVARGPVVLLAVKLLPVAAALFLFQGLAVAHALAHGRPGSRPWLTGLYLLLVLPLFNTLALVLVALTGLADAWADFRRRRAAR